MECDWVLLLSFRPASKGAAVKGWGFDWGVLPEVLPLPANYSRVVVSLPSSSPSPQLAVSSGV